MLSSQHKNDQRRCEEDSNTTGCFFLRRLSFLSPISVWLPDAAPGSCCRAPHTPAGLGGEAAGAGPACTAALLCGDGLYASASAGPVAANPIRVIRANDTGVLGGGDPVWYCMEQVQGNTQWRLCILAWCNITWQHIHQHTAFHECQPQCQLFI